MLGSSFSANVRNTSRKRLFALLRCGAFPIFLEVAMPIKPVPGKAVNRQNLPAARLPSLKISSNLVLLGPLMGQSGAAPQPPPLDYVLAVCRAHAHPESMGLFLVSVVGLIGAFRHLFGLSRLVARLYPLCTYMNHRGSAKRPLMAVAAAVRGLTRCVLDPGPCLPS